MKLAERLGALLIAIVIIALPINAQRSDTIYQTILSSSAALGPTITVNNIGQGEHTVWFRLSNAPALVCNPQVVNIFIEGSFDNVNFFRLQGSAGDNLAYIGLDGSGVLEQFLSVVGAVPYIRANINSFDNVNCRITVNYSGTLFPYTSDLTVPPWVQRPNGYVPFNNFGGIATPAATGVDTVVLTFTVPTGQDGVILGIITQYSAGTLIQGSGDLTWKIKQNGVAMTGYDSITFTLGSFSINPFPLQPLRIYSGDVITMTVAHAATSGLPYTATKVLGMLGGYFYPIKSR